jgi:hypothetical protein
MANGEWRKMRSPIGYGKAETFNRDTDFSVLADAANFARLRKALAELLAEPIAVPPFELK